MLYLGLAQFSQVKQIEIKGNLSADLRSLPIKDTLKSKKTFINLQINVDGNREPLRIRHNFSICLNETA